MVVPVPPPDAPCALGIVAGKGRSGHPQKGGNAAGDVVCKVVQLRGCAAKIKVLLVLVAQHAVHGVDGLVGQRQRCPADEHIQQRRNDAVAGIFGHRFHRSFGHTLCGQVLGVAAHDAAHGFASGGQVVPDQLVIHICALLRKAPCRQRLPAPEHLHRKAQPRAELCRRQTHKARDQKGAHRQAERRHGTAQQLALRGAGQAGTQEFFQPGDASSHKHHRVRQPRRVAEEGVQHKTADNCLKDHALLSFVYWTVFTRYSRCFSVQSFASSTKPPALGPHHA